MERIPGRDTKDSFELEVVSRDVADDITIDDKFENNVIIDKPKTFIREFLMEERNRIKSLQLKKLPDIQPNVVVGTKVVRSQGRCYTCNPRKKVREHIISNSNGVTFHHDMCNRNIIVVTPDRHYLTFDEVGDVEIGTIFREINKFCSDWNIVDYSVTYNQGSWQTHKHFHLKIKSYDNIITRMRGDHFRMLSLTKKYVQYVQYVQ